MGGRQMARNRLPEVLKDLRLSENLTQKQLAHETGLSLSAIISYENGFREPNSKAMAVLEKYFNVSGPFLRGELLSEPFKDKHRTVILSAKSLGNSFETYINILKTSLLNFQQETLIAPQDNQIDSFNFLVISLQYATNTISQDRTDYVKPEELRFYLDILHKLNPSGRVELKKRAIELSQLKMYRT